MRHSPLILGLSLVLAVALLGCSSEAPAPVVPPAPQPAADAGANTLPAGVVGGPGQPALVFDTTSQEKYDAALQDAFSLLAERKYAEALAALEAARIPAGPLHSPQQALEDRHIREAGLLADTEYPGLPRPAPLAPTPVDLSDRPGRFRRRAPTLGEHTDEILTELGYLPESIADLRARGVI